MNWEPCGKKTRLGLSQDPALGFFQTTSQSAIWSQINVEWSLATLVSEMAAAILAAAFHSLHTGVRPVTTAGSHRVSLSRSVIKAFQCLRRWEFCRRLLISHFLHFSSESRYCPK